MLDPNVQQISNIPKIDNTSDIAGGAAVTPSYIVSDVPDYTEVNGSVGIDSIEVSSGVSTPNITVGQGVEKEESANYIKSDVQEYSPAADLLDGLDMNSLDEVSRAESYIDPDAAGVQLILSNLKESGIINSGMSEEKAVLAVHGYIGSNFSYIADTGDHWNSVSETIKNGGGDCEDLANLEASLIISALIDRGLTLEDADKKVSSVVAVDLYTAMGHVYVRYVGENGQIKYLNPVSSKVTSSIDSSKIALFSYNTESVDIMNKGFDYSKLITASSEEDTIPLPTEQIEFIKVNDLNGYWDGVQGMRDNAQAVIDALTNLIDSIHSFFGSWSEIGCIDQYNAINGFISVLQSNPCQGPLALTSIKAELDEVMAALNSSSYLASEIASRQAAFDAAQTAYNNAETAYNNAVQADSDADAAVISIGGALQNALSIQRNGGSGADAMVAHFQQLYNQALAAQTTAHNNLTPATNTWNSVEPGLQADLTAAQNSLDEANSSMNNLNSAISLLNGDYYTASELYSSSFTTTAFFMEAIASPLQVGEERVWQLNQLLIQMGMAAEILNADALIDIAKTVYDADKRVSDAAWSDYLTKQQEADDAKNTYAPGGTSRTPQQAVDYEQTQYNYAEWIYKYSNVTITNTYYDYNLQRDVTYTATNTAKWFDDHWADHDSHDNPYFMYDDTWAWRDNSYDWSIAWSKLCNAKTWKSKVDTAASAYQTWQTKDGITGTAYQDWQKAITQKATLEAQYLNMYGNNDYSCINDVLVGPDANGNYTANWNAPLWTDMYDEIDKIKGYLMAVSLIYEAYRDLRGVVVQELSGEDTSYKGMPINKMFIKKVDKLTENYRTTVANALQAMSHLNQANANDKINQENEKYEQKMADIKKEDDPGMLEAWKTDEKQQEMLQADSDRKTEINNIYANAKAVEESNKIGARDHLTSLAVNVGGSPDEIWNSLSNEMNSAVSDFDSISRATLDETDDGDYKEMNWGKVTSMRERLQGAVNLRRIFLMAKKTTSNMRNLVHQEMTGLGGRTSNTGAAEAMSESEGKEALQWFDDAVNSVSESVKLNNQYRKNELDIARNQEMIDTLEAQIESKKNANWLGLGAILFGIVGAITGGLGWVIAAGVCSYLSGRIQSENDKEIKDKQVELEEKYAKTDIKLTDQSYVTSHANISSNDTALSVALAAEDSIQDALGGMNAGTYLNTLNDGPETDMAKMNDGWDVDGSSFFANDKFAAANEGIRGYSLLMMVAESARKTMADMRNLAHMEMTGIGSSTSSNEVDNVMDDERKQQSFIMNASCVSLNSQNQARNERYKAQRDLHLYQDQQKIAENMFNLSTIPTFLLMLVPGIGGSLASLASTLIQRGGSVYSNISGMNDEMDYLKVDESGTYDTTYSLGDDSLNGLVANGLLDTGNGTKGVNSSLIAETRNDTAMSFVSAGVQGSIMKALRSLRSFVHMEMTGVRSAEGGNFAEQANFVNFQTAMQSLTMINDYLTQKAQIQNKINDATKKIENLQKQIDHSIISAVGAGIGGTILGISLGLVNNSLSFGISIGCAAADFILAAGQAWNGWTNKSFADSLAKDDLGMIKDYITAREITEDRADSITNRLETLEQKCLNEINENLLQSLGGGYVGVNSGLAAKYNSYLERLYRAEKEKSGVSAVLREVRSMVHETMTGISSQTGNSALSALEMKEQNTKANVSEMFSLLETAATRCNQLTDAEKAAKKAEIQLWGEIFSAFVSLVKLCVTSSKKISESDKTNILFLTEIADYAGKRVTADTLKTAMIQAEKDAENKTETSGMTGKGISKDIKNSSVMADTGVGDQLTDLAASKAAMVGQAALKHKASIYELNKMNIESEWKDTIANLNKSFVFNDLANFIIAKLKKENNATPVPAGIENIAVPSGKPSASVIPMAATSGNLSIIANWKPNILDLIDIKNFNMREWSKKASLMNGIVKDKPNYYKSDSPVSLTPILDGILTNLLSWGKPESNYVEKRNMSQDQQNISVEPSKVEDQVLIPDNKKIVERNLKNLNINKAKRAVSNNSASVQSPISDKPVSQKPAMQETEVSQQPISGISAKTQSVGSNQPVDRNTIAGQLESITVLNHSEKEKVIKTFDSGAKVNGDKEEIRTKVSQTQKQLDETQRTIENISTKVKQAIPAGVQVPARISAASITAQENKQSPNNSTSAAWLDSIIAQLDNPKNGQIAQVKGQMAVVKDMMNSLSDVTEKEMPQIKDLKEQLQILQDQLKKVSKELNLEKAKLASMKQDVAKAQASFATQGEALEKKRKELQKSIKAVDAKLETQKTAKKGQAMDEGQKKVAEQWKKNLQAQLEDINVLDKEMKEDLNMIQAASQSLKKDIDEQGVKVAELSGKVGELKQFIVYTRKEIGKQSKKSGGNPQNGEEQHVDFTTEMFKNTVNV